MQQVATEEESQLRGREALPESVKEIVQRYATDWEKFFCRDKDFLPDSSNEIMKKLPHATLCALKPKDTLFTIDDVDRVTIRSQEALSYLLLEMWKELQAQGVMIHILVISRPYSDAGKLLEQVPTILPYSNCRGWWNVHV